MAAAKPRTQLLLAVIGAVLATVVTGALNTSPAGRLIGAALGAAIPVLVTAGGAQGLALSMLVTGGALFITYGGFTLFDYAEDREATFPIPRVMPPPAPGPAPIVTTEDGLSLEVTPEAVHCSSDGCDEDVTVKSTGAEVLEIRDIEFVGEAASDFGYGGNCEQHQLQKDEECEISVTFTPSGAGTREAALLIHQNLQGPATEVRVQGEAGGPEPPPPPGGGDVVLLAGSVKCVHQAGGAVVNGQARDALQIFFDLRLEGGSESPGAVRVEGRSNRGPADSRTGGIGEGRHLELALEPSSYGSLHTVTLRVDPNNELAESNEDNNRLSVSVFVPLQPAPTQVLTCSAS